MTDTALNSYSESRKFLMYTVSCARRCKDILTAYYSGCLLGIKLSIWVRFIEIPSPYNTILLWF